MEGARPSYFSPFQKSSAISDSMLTRKFLGSKDLQPYQSSEIKPCCFTSQTKSKLQEALLNGRLNHNYQNLSFCLKKSGNRKIRTRANTRKSSAQETADWSSMMADNSPLPSIGFSTTKKFKHSFTELVADKSVRNYSEAELLTLTDSQILNIATSQKDEALGLQLLIENCSEEVVSRLSKIALDNLEQLLVHPTGSFLIQKLVWRDSEFSKLITNYSQAHFKTMSENEFSSRVLQCLIERDSDFRRKAVQIFRQDLKSYIQSFSSAFLVSVAIKLADCDQEREFILFELFKNPKRLLSKKYFKRVLVAFIGSSSLGVLNVLFNTLLSVFTPYDFFRDRYSCLVLLALIERGFKPAVDIVIHCLRFNTYELLRWSVFKYMLERTKGDLGLASLRILISQILWNLPRQVMNQIQQNDKTYSAFIMAIQTNNGEN